MKKMICVGLIAGLCAASVTAHAQERAFELRRTIGGRLDGMVLDGSMAYVTTGRTIATWDHSDSDGPRHLNSVDEPASGILTGLVKVGGYLYASWRSGFGTSGVAVYSLAERSRPALVNEVQIDAPLSDVNAIAAANGHLYLFDSESGVIVGSLANPKRPVLRATGVGASVTYDQVFTDGDWIHAFGKNLMMGSVLTSFDVSAPRRPLATSSLMGDGISQFSMEFAAPFGVTFGGELTIFDLSNPKQSIPRGSAFGPSATTGILNGKFAYGVGFEGLDVWNIGNPDRPSHVSHVAIDTLGAAVTEKLARTALLLTSTDQFKVLDTSKPATPREKDAAVMPGSVNAYDAARVGDTVLLLQSNYGLAVADAATLEIKGRYEFDLPQHLQARAFSQMHVEGSLAYLAAWGYGLVIADVSKPRAPAEVSRLQFEAAHTVSVEKGYAYVGKNTNGPAFGIVDVSDAKQPNLLGYYELLYSPAQVEAREGYLYIPGYSNDASPVGLRIVDVHNPFAPIEVGFYDEDCGNAFGVAFAKDRPLAFLACGNGLHLLDIADVKQPVRIAWVPLPDMAHPWVDVAVRGTRAWYASPAGIYEIDVSDTKYPRVLASTDTAGYGTVNVRVLDDDRVAALTATAGIHVLERSALPLEDDKPVRGLSGKAGTTLLYRIEVPKGTRELNVRTQGGSGDVTLYVKHDAPPSPTDYDERSMRPGTNESIAISKAQSGFWYVKIVGEKDFERVQLEASYR